MNFWPEAPPRIAGRQCDICDGEILIGRPIAFEEDEDGIHVQDWHCYLAIEYAKLDGLRYAAVMARRLGRFEVATAILWRAEGRRMKLDYQTRAVA